MMGIFVYTRGGRYPRRSITYGVRRRRGEGWKPLKFSLERAVFVSDLVPYKNLIPRTDYTYCGRYTAVKVLSGRGVAGRRTIPRTLSHPAYLPANATYKHQFNVWNLSKWISLGSYRWPSFFFPRRIWSWCEISLYYCFARLVSHSCGKWTLFTDLFNDNYFFFFLSSFFFFFLSIDIRLLAGSIQVQTRSLNLFVKTFLFFTIVRRQ